MEQRMTPELEQVYGEGECQQEGRHTGDDDIPLSH